MLISILLAGCTSSQIAGMPETDAVASPTTPEPTTKPVPISYATDTYISIRGEKYYVEECSWATTLTLSGLNLTSTDIEPLKYLTTLTRLDLSHNQISDISALYGLINLRHLYLSQNQINDISPLCGLIDLRHLDLSQNQISDISPLRKLTNLNVLYLSYNQISDISSLAGLSKIRILSLAVNQISDISPLAEIQTFTWLFLDANLISDVTPIYKLSFQGSNTVRPELSLHANPISEADKIKLRSYFKSIHSENLLVID